MSTENSGWMMNSVPKNATITAMIWKRRAASFKKIAENIIRMNGLSLFNISASDKTDRKSTRLNSSHVSISYAVFCLKKKSKRHEKQRTRIYHDFTHIPATT